MNLLLDDSLKFIIFIVLWSDEKMVGMISQHVSRSFRYIYLSLVTVKKSSKSFHRFLITALKLTVMKTNGLKIYIYSSEIFTDRIKTVIIGS